MIRILLLLVIGTLPMTMQIILSKLLNTVDNSALLFSMSVSIYGYSFILLYITFFGRRFFERLIDNVIYFISFISLIFSTLIITIISRLQANIIHIKLFSIITSCIFIIDFIILIFLENVQRYHVVFDYDRTDRKTIKIKRGKAIILTIKWLATPVILSFLFMIGTWLLSSYEGSILNHVAIYGFYLSIVLIVKEKLQIFGSSNT